MTATHYYVWYRVPAGHDAARRAVDAMQARLRAATGVAGRLLVRRDDPSTWMEIYEGVTDVGPFEAALDEAVAGAARAGLAIDGRHVERFVAPD